MGLFKKRKVIDPLPVLEENKRKAAQANVLGLIYYERGKLYFSPRSAGSYAEILPEDVLIESTEQFVETLKKKITKSMLRA